MYIGLFGGAFDPIHYGHLLLADQCLELCELNEVWFIPTGIPPHKNKPIASSKERLSMLKLATKDHFKFRINNIEIERNCISYTIDTINQLKKRFPTFKFCVLIADEWLLQLKSWKNYNQIINNCQIVAVNRGGRKITSKNIIQSLDDELKKKITFIKIPGIELSSSDIRQRIKDKKSIKFMTTKNVESFILKNNLYA